MTQLRKAKRRQKECTGIPSTDGSSAEIQLTRDIPSDQAEEISKPTVTSEPDNQPLLTSVPAEEISTPPNSETHDQPLLSGEMVTSGDETVPSTATNILELAVTEYKLN